MEQLYGDKTTCLTGEESWIDCRQESESLQSAQTPLWPTQLLFNWHRELLPQGVKRLGREADNPSNLLHILWRATYFCPICLHGMNSNIFTLLDFTLLYFTVVPKACKRLGYQVRILFGDPGLIFVEEAFWQAKCGYNFSQTMATSPFCPSNVNRPDGRLSHGFLTCPTNTVTYWTILYSQPKTPHRQLFRSFEGITPIIVLSFQQVTD